MTFRVINNPSFQPQTGFTHSQFKRLDELYCRAVSEKAMSYRTVDCDFNVGIAQYTYFKNEYQPFLYRFIIRTVGPHTLMYEVYKHGKGRIFKSGVFERAYQKLADEITALF